MDFKELFEISRSLVNSNKILSQDIKQFLEEDVPEDLKLKCSIYYNAYHYLLNFMNYLYTKVKSEDVKEKISKFIDYLNEDPYRQIYRKYRVIFDRMLSNKEPFNLFTDYDSFLKFCENFLLELKEKDVKSINVYYSLLNKISLHFFNKSLKHLKKKFKIKRNTTYRIPSIQTVIVTLLTMKYILKKEIKDPCYVYEKILSTDNFKSTYIGFCFKYFNKFTLLNLYILFMTALETGARLIELSRLRPEDILSLPSGYYVKLIGKRSIPRIVKISEQLYKKLTKLANFNKKYDIDAKYVFYIYYHHLKTIHAMIKKRIFNGDKSEIYSSYRFKINIYSENNMHLRHFMMGCCYNLFLKFVRKYYLDNYDVLSKYFQKALKLSFTKGISEITSHQLRHFHAVYLYNKTKDIYLVKERLGHKNLRDTLIYTKYVHSSVKATDQIKKEVHSLIEMSDKLSKIVEFSKK